jgi:hypothetical protein
MRKSLTLAALTLSLVLPAAVQAHGYFVYGQRQTDEYGFKKTHAPRAAPWFMYWPYPAYFSYPAPTGVAFPPEAMTPGGFYPHMYNGAGPGQGFLPYPTNGFGQ